MEPADRVRELLVRGDNRLKHGNDDRARAAARKSWEQALAVAREHGLEARVRPLVEARLADLDRASSD